MYEYRVNIVKIVDGDTVDVDIDLGFGIWLRNERVRILGIDTPESRTSDDIEKKFGLAAKKRVTELLGDKSILVTQSYFKEGGEDKGKFGRILGDFLIGKEKERLTMIMIAEGQAVEYWGQSKDDIKEAHLKNRERLLSEGKVTLEE